MFRPTERYNPYPDHREWTVWQPDQIWGGTAAAIKEAVSKLDNPHHIKAVAVTGMGMDGVPIDKQGNWLHPFINRHDPRTETQLQLYPVLAPVSHRLYEQFSA
ncbi:MAG: hypothetical protein H8D34_19980 [Chloroflexi bacterium]|nr:hypothetical protein [Chloroflexota bacterium]